MISAKVGLADSWAKQWRKGQGVAGLGEAGGLVCSGLHKGFRFSWVFIGFLGFSWVFLGFLRFSLVGLVFALPLLAFRRDPPQKKKFWFCEIQFYRVL